MAVGLALAVFAASGCDSSEISNDDPPASADAGSLPDDVDAAPAATPDAGPPVPASDPAGDGPFDAHVADNASIPVGTGTATATVCSPSSDGGATPAAGPFPLVISSPGFQLPRTQYRSACEHLARWGFVVVSQDYGGSGDIGSTPNHQELAEDVSDVIDWALGGDSGLASRLDPNKIATVGHSMGGKVSILAAILDSRIRAVVGWDPVDAKPPIDNGSPSVTPELMDQLTVPLAVVGETLDGGGGFMPCAPTADNYAQYVDNACASPDVLEVTVDGADHMDWVDDRGTCGFTCSFCQTGSTDDAHTREITRRVTTGFLLEALMDADGYDAFLASPGVGTGATVRRASGC